MKQQRARERRRTIAIQAGVGLAVVLAVLLVTVAVLRAQDPGEPAVAPAGVDAEGRYVLGDPDAPVQVSVVEDFQCPFCAQLEADAGDLLAGYAAGEDVAVGYRGIAALDRASTTDYSSRALNASACVMAEGDDVWSAFHAALYAEQPPEGGAGLDDDTLVDLAVAAGAAEDDVRGCIVGGEHDDWVAQTTADALEDVDGTPTVLVDGQEVDSPSAATIAAAVAAAQERP